MDPLRPALALRAPPRIAQQGLRAVGAGHAVAGAGERDRVAPEPARRVEHVAAVRRPRELRRGERLRLGLGVGLVVGERTQVELAEELVPPLRGADARALHAVRVYGGDMELETWLGACGRGDPEPPSFPVLLYRGTGLTTRTPRASGSPPTAGVARGSTACFAFHHFHSTSHEVLAVVAGSATLELGGPQGRAFEVSAGDVVVLPAGTGHRRVAGRDGFTVVGAYPAGQEDYEPAALGRRRRALAHRRARPAGRGPHRRRRRGLLGLREGHGAGWRLEVEHHGQLLLRPAEDDLVRRVVHEVGLREAAGAEQLAEVALGCAVTGRRVHGAPDRDRPAPCGSRRVPTS